jgi:hypothetical protein
MIYVESTCRLLYCRREVEIITTDGEFTLSPTVRFEMVKERVTAMILLVELLLVLSHGL